MALNLNGRLRSTVDNKDSSFTIDRNDGSGCLLFTTSNSYIKV